MIYPSIIAIKVSKAAERAVKQGHPWVFEKSIVKASPADQEAGSLCILFDQKTNRPFAFGLWDPSEIIKIKIIHLGTRLTLDSAYWEKRMRSAYLRRQDLLAYTNAYRGIHGENDGFPGLILDIYDRTGVLKVYSHIWRPYIEQLIHIAIEIFDIDSLVFRFSRKLTASHEYPYSEGEVIGQELTSHQILFLEQGVRFYAYPISGHKTGFFLDQRSNRAWLQTKARDKSILDVFSYVGSFGIHALKGGASSLTSIDISSQAMEVARKNLFLNELDISRWVPLVGDAFQQLTQLKNDNRVFDIVVIDPPAFAKQSTEVDLALSQYKRLAKLGAKLTTKDSYLLLASCSSRITPEDFKAAHRKAFAHYPHKEWKVVKEGFHDIDHPVSYREGLYLKTIIYQRSQ